MSLCYHLISIHLKIKVFQNKNYPIGFSIMCLGISKQLQFGHLRVAEKSLQDLSRCYVTLVATGSQSLSLVLHFG